MSTWLKLVNFASYLDVQMGFIGDADRLGR